jgi:hypothetical protein
MKGPSASSPPSETARQAVLTAVYGRHAEQLDRTFASFARVKNCSLHAFVVGDTLPRNQAPGIRYHLRPPDPRFLHPLRDVDFRRWLFVDEVEADFVLVVDGADVLCLRPLEPLSDLLKGGAVGAVVEHNGGRYLETGQYTSNFVNAGVTFWNVAASRELRQKIVARGRRHFRNLIDDQLALNELLHTEWFDRLTLLPCQYNYRGSLGPRPFGWPRVHSLDGVRIYHNKHWLNEARARAETPAHGRAVPLPTDAPPPGPWQQRWRRLKTRLSRKGLPPWWPRG